MNYLSVNLTVELKPRSRDGRVVNIYHANTLQARPALLLASMLRAVLSLYNKTDEQAEDLNQDVHAVAEWLAQVKFEREGEQTRLTGDG